MKIIFLNPFGSLMHANSKVDKHGNFIRVDKRSLKNLKRIVAATGAKIVLCQSPDLNWQAYNKQMQSPAADHLDFQLWLRGMSIFDKASEIGHRKARGVSNWCDTHRVTSFVVLDFKGLGDYEEEGLSNYLIEVKNYGTPEETGITDLITKEIISRLNKE